MFFPSNWSSQKVIEVIFDASQSRVSFIQEIGFKKKFECKGPGNMIIDIVIDQYNVITSAYPSLKNFKEL